MAKLIFRFGAMGASKTANALMVVFNYNEKGMKAALLKPACENRDGDSVIRSRIGLTQDCLTAEDYIEDVFQSGMVCHDNVIVIDEAQFLAPGYIDMLADIVDRLDVPVICYGLRTDFKSELFPGSKRLMELADTIEEIPTICWCGCKARFNARIKNGRIVKNGPQVVMGGNESYISLCRKHYMSEQVADDFFSDNN